MFKGFEEHDCGTCPTKDTCAIMGIKDFLSNHNNEVDCFLETMVEVGVGIGKVACELNPMTILITQELVDAIKFSLVCGYFKGRTYQDVPEVFKEA